MSHTLRRVRFKCGHVRELQMATLCRGQWHQGSKFLNRCRPCEQAHKAYYNARKGDPRPDVCPCGFCQAKAEKRAAKAQAESEVVS